MSLIYKFSEFFYRLFLNPRAVNKINVSGRYDKTQIYRLIKLTF